MIATLYFTSHTFCTLKYSWDTHRPWSERTKLTKLRYTSYTTVLLGHTPTLVWERERAERNKERERERASLGISRNIWENSTTLGRCPRTNSASPYGYHGTMVLTSAWAHVPRWSMSTSSNALYPRYINNITTAIIIVIHCILCFMYTRARTHTHTHIVI